MKIKFKITQQDINKAGYGYNDCPVALAIKRRLKTKVHRYIAVRPRRHNLIFIGKTKFPLDKLLFQFTERHDLTTKTNLKPTTFELDVPEKYLKS